MSSFDSLTFGSQGPFIIGTNAIIFFETKEKDSPFGFNIEMLIKYIFFST
jgi:hypothetical protein